jgi:hypothetical protein
MFCAVPRSDDACRWAVRTKLCYRTFPRREDALTWARNYRLHTGRKAIVERTEV